MATDTQVNFLGNLPVTIFLHIITPKAQQESATGIKFFGGGN
jgi:hypothetical protein